MDKLALRRMIAERKRHLTRRAIEAASANLAQQLLAHPLYLAAPAIYAYLSFNQEVRTETILRRALADGKRVAVPKVSDGEICFYYYDETTVLAPGAYGILEPVDAVPAADRDALVLLPGLAFDPAGHRIGYGGGYYDRFLAREMHPTLALCYDFQLLPALPAEAHDKAADAVLTAPVQEDAE